MSLNADLNFVPFCFSASLALTVLDASPMYPTTGSVLACIDIVINCAIPHGRGPAIVPTRITSNLSFAHGIEPCIRSRAVLCSSGRPYPYPSNQKTEHSQISFLLLLGIVLLLGAWTGNAEWKDGILAVFAFGRDCWGSADLVGIEFWCSHLELDAWSVVLEAGLSPSSTCRL